MFLIGKNQITKEKRRSIFNFTEAGITIALVLLCLILSFASPYFITIKNIFNVLRQISVIAILAIGMAFVINSACIDLSVGWILGLCGVCAALLTNWNINPLLVFIMTLGIGSICGLVNGVFVTKLKLPPFIATLGTGYIFRGTTLLLTNAKPIPFESPLAELGSGYWGPVPISVVIMIIVMIVGIIISKKTVLGRNVYAVGNNEKAAVLSGISVAITRNAVYMILGALAGISGIMVTGNIYHADPMSGSGYEMDAICAAVIGGVSLMGGEGSIFGVIIGAALMGVLRNGFVLLQISSFVQILALGVVILVAVYIDITRKKRAGI